MVAPYVLAAQEVHAVAPELALYFPAAHAAPAAVIEPAAQKLPAAAKQAPEQAAVERPADAPKVPAGHEVHAVRPVVAPYVPAAHEVHAVAPELLLYVPAAQAPEQAEVVRPAALP